MAPVHIIWDVEDDADGNYWHIVVEGHGVTREEVEEVLLDPRNETVLSRTSGQWITFGWTSPGQHLAVVWENVLDNPRTVYPLTVFPAPPKRRRR